jgi:hypothetical protein
MPAQFDYKNTILSFLYHVVFDPNFNVEFHVSEDSAMAEFTAVFI